MLYAVDMVRCIDIYFVYCSTQMEKTHQTLAGVLEPRVERVLLRYVHRGAASPGCIYVRCGAASHGCIYGIYTYRCVFTAGSPPAGAYTCSPLGAASLAGAWCV